MRLRVGLPEAKMRPDLWGLSLSIHEQRALTFAAMSETAAVIPLDARLRQDAYAQMRAQLTAFLARHALIGSYHEYRRLGRPYPFLDARAAISTTFAPTGPERKLQRSALVLLVDGALPAALNKHLRRRSSNQLTWSNLRRFAPDLDLAGFKAAHARADSAEFEALLAKLVALDYALLLERADEIAPFALSHFHVKVDRPTDLALAEFGRRLGYVERRLFERGEDFAEALEAKFFECHGFGANASGRKSAAAIAAQLFAGLGLRFTIYVASQSDGRLTLLDEREGVAQHLLIRLSGPTRATFDEAMLRHGGDPEDYLVAEEEGDPVVLYRLRFGRTAAARPSPERTAERDLSQPWLEVAEQAVLPLKAGAGRIIPFAWAERRRS
jgi:hypothetical protein